MIPLLLPTQSVYLPGQAILVEASHPGDLVVTHLGEAVPASASSIWEN